MVDQVIGADRRDRRGAAGRGARAGLAHVSLVFACATGPAAELTRPDGEGKGRDAPRAARRAMRRDLLTDLADDGSLVAGLVDPSPDVRRVATRGLARLPDAQGVLALASRTDHEEDPAVLAEILFALGQRGAPASSAPDASPALLASLTHADAGVRAAAASGLGRLSSDDATDEPSPTCSGTR